MPSGGNLETYQENEHRPEGFAALYGGPAAAILPEHSHAEAQVTVRFASRATTHKLAPAHIDLCAPRQTHSGGWKDGWEVVVFHLSQQRLEEAAEELVSFRTLRDRPKTQKNATAFLKEMARTVLHEFRNRENMSRLYLEFGRSGPCGTDSARHC